jgi:hypothetical protein
VKWLASELDFALAVVRIGTHQCVMVRIWLAVRIDTHLCVMVRIWLASELDVALAEDDYYVRRRAAPSVMGLLPSPSVLARWAFVGGAPSVLV